MVRFLQLFAAALVALSVTAGAAQAQRTHVYLLRGFMDIFSTGMDDLGSKMNRRGIQASVHNHSEFQNLAAAIIERHKRGIRENVVIVGHSLGGNDAFRMAEYLGAAKINVPLIIAFDPTASMSVPGNVSRVINFYSSTNGWGVPIMRGPGFRGSLSNVDLSRRGEMGHTDIDKSPSLHSQSISYVLSIGGSRRSSGTASKPEADDNDGAAKSGKNAEKDSGPKAADKESASGPAGEPASGAAGTAVAAPAETTGSATPASAKTETAASPPAEPKSSN